MFKEYCMMWTFAITSRILHLWQIKSIRRLYFSASSIQENQLRDVFLQKSWAVLSSILTTSWLNSQESQSEIYTCRKAPELSCLQKNLYVQSLQKNSPENRWLFLPAAASATMRLLLNSSAVSVFLFLSGLLKKQHVTELSVKLYLHRMIPL